MGGQALNGENTTDAKTTGAKTAGYADVLGREPEFDAQPRSVEEIAEAVAWADKPGADGAGKAVIPWGGGGGQSYGYAPARADILLDLTRLNRIIALEPGDLTTTVEAGATLASVQDALARHGQYLPLSVPDAETATIGGILATAAASNNAARDFLIGITVVDAQGRIVKGGGKVVKNVTGYDIPKMHVGALGTLGIIVEATFKTAPLPEATQTLYFSEASELFLRRLHAETQPKTSFWTKTNEVASLLVVNYSGVAEVVADEAAKAQKIGAETGVSLTGEPIPFAIPQLIPEFIPLVVRTSGLPDSAASRHKSLWEMHFWQCVETEPLTGAATVFSREGTEPDDALRALVTWADANRAKIAVLRAPLSLRRGDFALWHPLPPSLPLMRRLKKILDPNATLNPGRFLGGI